MDLLTMCVQTQEWVKYDWLESANMVIHNKARAEKRMNGPQNKRKHKYYQRQVEKM